MIVIRGSLPFYYYLSMYMVDSTGLFSLLYNLIIMIVKASLPLELSYS